MGRKRKDDPFGLAGTRIYIRRGKFFYAHRTRGWEMLPTTDPVEAKRLGHAIENPAEDVGTIGYWLKEFLADCKRRVAAKQLSQRTLDDYTAYCDPEGPLIAFFGAIRPEALAPNLVQAYLDENARLVPPRLTQSNRERACLSSMLSWLLRRADNPVPGLKVNPCMRASGVKRNPEKKRERYVTHEEYRAVYEAGNRAVRLAMELVYRTLQRPEVDVLEWTPAHVRVKDGGKVLRFRQSKTGRQLDIALVGELGDLVKAAIGDVPVLKQPILHRLDGAAYTYSGLSAMLKQAQAKVRAAHAKTGGPLAKMPSFGLRDLKGKGATDMWLDGVPIERIQLLCGHSDKRTTETYIKARWTETAQPNNRQMG